MSTLSDLRAQPIEASNKLRSAIFWRAEKNLRQAKYKLVSRGELLRAKKLLRSGCGKPNRKKIQFSVTAISSQQVSFHLIVPMAARRILARQKWPSRSVFLADRLGPKGACYRGVQKAALSNFLARRKKPEASKIQASFKG
jgi:hypothetical protein